MNLLLGGCPESENGHDNSVCAPQKPINSRWKPALQAIAARDKEPAAFLSRYA
ncbi:hypothetical protein [Paraburkholderia lycopersici]|uniref:hypothetical protein n=1 Tax=Paraburkholderia lycopersici TaxID=416944 RepID=UPI0015A3F876|nr:hypothetical protein [Paraburkholderia lycopersici]